MDVVLLILGVIVAFVGIAAVFLAENRGTGVVTLAGCGAVTAILFSLAFTYTLGANEVGIEVARGKIGTTEGPGGWHGKAPWTKVEKLTVLPYTADAADITLRTKDGGEFAARFIPRWHTDQARAVSLYRQTRTGDEGDITRRIIDPLLSGIASDTAKTLRNDNTLDATGKVTEEGVASMSTLTFGKRVKDALAPLLEQKGILLDDVTISGDFTLSDAMRAQLANLAASKAKTQVALQDEQTAKAEAAASRERATAANSIPTLSPAQVSVYCAQLWAAEARRATEKGVALYTSPCGASNAQVLIGAK